MQFLVIAYDGEDEQAGERRQAARDAHLALAAKMRENGSMLFAAAILNDQQQMIGSTIVCEFENREKLNDWLSVEPYVVGGVWKDIQAVPCVVPPIFLN